MRKAFTHLLLILFPALVFCQQPKTTPSSKQFDELKKEMQDMQQQLQSQLKTLQDSISKLQEQLKGRSFMMPEGKIFIPDSNGYSYHYYNPGDQAEGYQFFGLNKDYLDKLKDDADKLKDEADKWKDESDEWKEKSDKWKDAWKDMEIPQWDIKKWKEEYPEKWKEEYPDLFQIPKYNWQYEYKMPEMPKIYIVPPTPEMKKHNHDHDDWKHSLPFYDLFNKS